MGYETHRFKERPDDELTCPICSGVLEDPVQVPVCEHAFCRACINQWMSRQQTCPVDRGKLRASSLQPAPRVLRNFLAKLEIECDFSPAGCLAVVKLDALDTHVLGCDFNPKKPIPCESGCGLVVAKDEMKDHNCVRDLRSQLRQTEERAQLVEHQVNEIRRELSQLKDCLRGLRLSTSSNAAGASASALLSSALADSSLLAVDGGGGPDELIRWANGLQRARVTRWGGMISTPDAGLQETVRKSLADSGCPPLLVDLLLENSHERRWPPGLATLETRQLNRRFYDNYLARRIPGRQAVVVLACENRHIPEDMILDPGLVMIFAQGIDSQQQQQSTSS